MAQYLEHIQKTALKIIYKGQYVSYENALRMSNLKTLKDRRNELCLTFAKRCLKNEKAKDIFPLNSSKNANNVRNPNTFQVYHANTKRLQQSPIIFMQHLLNAEFS